MATARNQAAGGAKSGYTPEPFDWFIEEEWAVDLLLECETFKGEIVDPACGQGTIPACAMRNGYRVSGSDLVDRPRIAEFPFRKLDFLGEEWNGHRVVDNVFFNPPFSYEKNIAERMIRRALRVSRRKVAAFLPNKFNSSQGRYALFTGTPLARIYWFCSRPSMPPGSLLTAGKITAGGGKVDYCVMVWDWEHAGPSTNHYLIHPEDLDREIKKQAKKKEAA
jgi:hypothetical protein